MFPKQCTILSLLTAVSLGVCSCAGLDGFPKEVVSTKAITDTCSEYNGTDILRKYESLNAVRQKAFLNEVQHCRVAEIDGNYDDFKRNLSLQDNTWNLGSDAALLGLTGATAVAGGTAVKSILGAASAGLTGTKTAVDKDLFFQKTMPVIVAQMDADRQKAYATMLQHQVDAQVAGTPYTMAQLLQDLKAYENAGNVNDAIISLANAAGTEKNAEHVKAAASAARLQ